jgi:hypothetical protein
MRWRWLAARSRLRFKCMSGVVTLNRRPLGSLQVLVLDNEHIERRYIGTTPAPILPNE